MNDEVIITPFIWKNFVQFILSAGIKIGFIDKTLKFYDEHDLNGPIIGKASPNILFYKYNNIEDYSLAFIHELGRDVVNAEHSGMTSENV